MQDRVVHIENVSKVFNRHHSVNNITFHINKGECFALCGGNGAGKSTIIQMLIGVLKPTSGTIQIQGQEVSSKKGSLYKSLFSFMPDAMSFSPVLTGCEVLQFFAKLQGLSQQRVDDLLALVGLEKDKHKKVRAYSKGMQQRLALAQSLLPSAPLLILDEPTNGLDPYWVFEFKKIIKAEKEKGTTILFSSHILSDVEELADRVAFMEEGKLLVVDEVANLVKEDSTLEQVFFNLIGSVKRSC